MNWKFKKCDRKCATSTDTFFVSVSSTVLFVGALKAMKKGMKT